MIINIALGAAGNVVRPLGFSRAHVKRYHIFSLILRNLLADKLFKLLSK